MQAACKDNPLNHGSFLNEKGAFLNGGKLREIIAVVESHTPRKEKCHPRQQEISLPQQCGKSRSVANPFMLILDQVSLFALKQHKKYLTAHVLLLIHC